MRRAVNPETPNDYPPNIQAIIKRRSPTSAWLDLQLLEIDSDEGWCKVAYNLGEPHFNRFGALHGGSIACAMDDVLAIAAGLVLEWGQIAPTLEMKVSYLNQGGPGRHYAEARVLKRGRTVNFLEATLSREDGKPIATATATIMIAEMKKKA
ncbi:MAG: hotdog fold thioesterase [Alphaproteobacteria bacterium]|nr:hotdog fold thioesterase [Alphaproteobacteria bacterium]